MVEYFFKGFKNSTMQFMEARFNCGLLCILKYPFSLIVILGTLLKKKSLPLYVWWGSGWKWRIMATSPLHNDSQHHSSTTTTPTCLCPRCETNWLPTIYHLGQLTLFATTFILPKLLFSARVYKSVNTRKVDTYRSTNIIRILIIVKVSAYTTIHRRVSICTKQYTLSYK